MEKGKGRPADVQQLEAETDPLIDVEELDQQAMQQMADDGCPLFDSEDHPSRLMRGGNLNEH